MNEEFMKSMKELNYAELKREQENKLREIEKNFNEEFGTDYYLMALRRDNTK